MKIKVGQLRTIRHLFLSRGAIYRLLDTHALFVILPKASKNIVCVSLDLKQQKNQRKCIDVSYLKQEGAVIVLEIQSIPFSQSSAKLIVPKTNLSFGPFFSNILLLDQELF